MFLTNRLCLSVLTWCVVPQIKEWTVFCQNTHISLLLKSRKLHYCKTLNVRFRQFTLQYMDTKQDLWRQASIPLRRAEN